MASKRTVEATEVSRLICAYLANVSQERIFARASLFGILALAFVMVALQVWINTINGDLFTALQNRDIRGFFHALGALAAGIVGLAIIWLGRLFVEETFELRWRRWLTKLYLDRWTANEAFHRIRFLGSKKAIDNPDQRIAEDIKKLESPASQPARRLAASLVSCSPGHRTVLSGWHLPAGFSRCFSLSLSLMAPRLNSAKGTRTLTLVSDGAVQKIRWAAQV